MRNVMGVLRRELNLQIIAGSSTLLTSINTLYGGTNAVAGTGFLESDPIGGQTNVVGGIDKALYQSTTGWQNQAVDIAGAFGTNGEIQMQSAYQRANARAAMGQIDLVILSESAMANYRRTLGSNQRYVGNDVLDSGRMNLAFGGAIVEQDLDLGFTGTSATWGNSPVSGYMINFDGIKMVFHSDADFSISPFEHVSGSTARAAQLYVKCQLIADHLGSQAVLYDGDTF